MITAGLGALLGLALPLVCLRVELAGEGAHQERRGGHVRFSYHDMDIYAAMGSWVSHHIRQALRTYSRQQGISCLALFPFLLLGAMLGGILDPLGYS